MKNINTTVRFCIEKFGVPLRGPTYSIYSMPHISNFEIVVSMSKQNVTNLRIFQPGYDTNFIQDSLFSSQGEFLSMGVRRRS